MSSSSRFDMIQSMENQKQSRILRASLMAGIVIVLNLFFNYSLSLIYKQPTYEAFCPTQTVVKTIDTQNECVANGGQWTENAPAPAPIPAPAGGKAITGYCNQQFSCENDFQAAQKAYDRNIFISLVLLGAICVALGSYLRGNALLGSSLSLAGVLSFIIASMRYWSSADDLAKVVILGIALAILITVAVRKFKN